MGDEAAGFTRGIADQRAAQVAPHDLAVLAQVALLHLIGVDLAGQRAAHEGPVRLNILRMGEAPGTRRQQLRGGVAQHGAEGLVDAQHRGIGTGQQHAHRRMLEGNAEELLAFPERGGGMLAGDVAGSGRGRRLYP